MGDPPTPGTTMDAAKQLKYPLPIPLVSSFTVVVGVTIPDCDE